MYIADYVNELVTLCHSASVKAGWWHKDGEHLINQPNIVPTKLALVHSEISEALEGYRKSSKDSHLPHHDAITVELADALIRIFDLAGVLKLPLGEAFIEKMAYNTFRADHKPEARNAPGGKAF